MRVVGNRVLIAPNERRTTTDSGLILPPSAQEDSQVGLVLAVGEGRYSEKSARLIPIDHIDPGDIVMYSKYGGTVIEVEGEEMLLVEPKDIFAVLNDDDDAEGGVPMPSGKFVDAGEVRAASVSGIDQLQALGIIP